MSIEPYSYTYSPETVGLLLFFGALLFVGCIVLIFNVLIQKEPDFILSDRMVTWGLPIFFILAGLFIIVGFSGSSWYLSQRTQKVKQELQPQRLVFAGKVVNRVTGDWPNDRLVLLFLRDKEIARTTSKLMEVNISGQGPTDGVFVIQANNDYKLSLQDINAADDLGLEADVGKAKEITEATTFLGRPTTKERDFTILYYWINEMEEGGQYPISIPSKNTEYTVMVLKGNVGDLPSAIQSGPLELREDGGLIAAVTDVSSGEIVGNSNVKSVSPISEPEIVYLKKVTVPINNCGGSARIAQSYSYSQTYIHEYHNETGGTIGVEVPVGAWLSLIAELEKRYGFEQGEVSTQTIEYAMAAEPLTNQIYTITWKEIWQSGIAEVAIEGGAVTIPFRAKINLIYEVESEKRECN